MKQYIKENQVYTVQEGSELEVQLIADGFEVLEETKPASRSKRADTKASEDAE